jgi:UDP-2-acetamido-2-deoxy-ribo-hexuluronate aminotransferase
MIPFIDLAAQQKRIYSGLERRIKEVLAHGKYIMGPEVGELEERLAGYAGVKHAIACSSGTDALLMPLMAYGVGPGDAVFTSPFTFIATAEVIALLGATPIFVDIDPRTFNMDPERLELVVEAVKNGDQGVHPLPIAGNGQLTPKGIIAVDLFGLPADYERINAVAKDNGLFVIEDAAQSFGATFEGKRAGALAHVAATSFFPAKPLGCYGDGGAVLTDSDDLADIMDSIRVHGKGKEKYDNVRVGINGRLDTLQAAVLLEKLEVFQEEIEARNRVAERYSEGLKDLVQVPYIPEGSISAWAQYSIVPEEREGLQEALKNYGIPTAIYYPKPLHLQGAFADLGYKPGDFPVSEEMSRKIFSLPMHPYLEEDTIDRIAGVIRSILSR